MRKLIFVLLVGLFMAGVVSAADLSWAPSGFTVYESSSLVSGAGTEVCSLSLTDTDNQVVACTGSGMIADSTDYCLEYNITNLDAGEVKWKWANAEDSVNGYFNIVGVMGAGNIFGSGATVNDCDFILYGGEHKNGPLDCHPQIHTGAADTIQFWINATNNRAEIKLKDTAGEHEGLRVCITTGTGVTSDSSNYLFTHENKGGIEETSNNISFVINADPVIHNITASDSTIQGGDTITIYANTSANGVNDSDADTLQLFCDSTVTPTLANSDCIGGATSDTDYPYILTCTFPVPSDDVAHVEYCRIYDSAAYSSNVSNITYTTDSTPPSLTIDSVAGDASASYYDTNGDGLTQINVTGEAEMFCRWSSSDVSYSSMSNACDIDGTTASCSVNNVVSQGFATRYISCQDSLGNEANSANNLDVSFTLDYTAPTTSSDASSTIISPDYTVTISEADNTDSDPTTLYCTDTYCTDTANTCVPSISIDHLGTVTFTSANRGANYLRFNSSDDAGKVQAVQSSPININ
ncbi:hypothetical protein HOA55_05315 [archaeon]|jgi:hypothetical protein|nr:hypothetical protein [archaeon]MBT3577741.1 hypothetical protein [archaeon]MBT6820748.1 hypothetical protein [archaeon]MBT6956425.1 hypothetical protein [archaeon]MBT7025888.1 hypothetical protein [archaeon]